MLICSLDRLASRSTMACRSADLVLRSIFTHRAGIRLLDGKRSVPTLLNGSFRASFLRRMELDNGSASCCGSSGIVDACPL